MENALANPELIWVNIIAFSAVITVFLLARKFDPE